MNILKILDKKYTFGQQKLFLKNYIFFGIPFGVIFTEILKISQLSWEKYEFNILKIFIIILFDLLIFSPLIYNYFKHRKRYNYIVKKVINKSINDFKIKALYDYWTFGTFFEKGKSYEFCVDYESGNMRNKYTEPILYIITGSSGVCYLENFINKFELDDLKYQRKKKLERLKKIAE